MKNILMKNLLTKQLMLFISVIMLLSITLIASSNAYAATTPATTGFSNTAGRAISIAVVNQDPDPVLAGNTFDVRLSVSNAGSASVGGLVVEVVPTYPFIAVEGESYTQTTDLNAFQSGSESQILKYTLRVNKEATQGTYYLTVKYYNSGSDNTTSVSQNIAISVGNSQNVEIIHIDKTVLIPGKQSDLKFVINNVGSASLKNIKFYWKNTDGVILPVGSDNTRYIKYLDIGDSAEVDYQVIADTNADSGLYPLDLYLSYKDSTSNTDIVVNTLAGIYVGGGTDFDVAFSDSTTGTTSFTIANVGSNPATSVSVIIPEQRGWSVSGSNSVIIGNLNKGDYTVAGFKLQSNSGFGRRNSTGTETAGSNSGSGTSQDKTNYPTNMTSPNTMLMQIAYTDTMGERLLINKTVKITLSNQTSLSSAYGARTATKTPNYTLYALIAVVVLVVGFVGYKRYKKNKLLGSDNAKEMRIRKK